MEYRIHVNNKFAAIETEEEEMDIDPLDTLRKLQDQLAEKKTAVKKAPTGVTKTEKPKVPKTSAEPSSTKAITQKVQKAARPSNEHKPANDSSVEQRPERNGFRGGRGGPRRGAFRGARGGAEGGRREFDRHSGSDKSGVKAQDKRDGGGAHNWGSVRDDINEHLNNAGAANPVENSSPQKHEEAAPSMSAEEIAEKEAALAAHAAEREAEEKQMTLEEWKRMEEEKRVKAKFNIRKPNEGSSETAKWKKMYQLKKKNEEEEEEEEEEEVEEEHEERKAKNVVPITITFTDSRNQGNPRRGGPRGGMRGGRGGRGGGRLIGDGFKPHSKAAVVPNVDDEKDFPSLS